MNFYFCEACGKRLTEIDINEGKARDKKFKGVYCKDCALGVMTMETLPLTNEQARQVLRSSAPQKSAPAHEPRRIEKHAAPAAARNSPALLIVSGVAVLAMLGVLLLLSRRSEAPVSTAANPQVAAPAQPPVSQAEALQKAADAAFISVFDGVGRNDIDGRISRLTAFIAKYPDSPQVDSARVLMDELRERLDETTLAAPAPSPSPAPAPLPEPAAPRPAPATAKQPSAPLAPSPAGPSAGAAGSYSKLFVGDDMKKFWVGKHWYFGADSKSSGAWLDFEYSGKGPFPRRQKIFVKLGETRPAGVYYVHVKSYYKGTLEVNVGSARREVVIPHAGATKWIACGRFEPAAPFDEVVLTYSTDHFDQDNGVAQKRAQFARGVFITTEESTKIQDAATIIDAPPSK